MSTGTARARSAGVSLGRERLREAFIVGAVAIGVAVLAWVILSLGPTAFVVGIVSLVAASSVVAAIADKPVALVGLLVAMSAGQRALSALTQSSAALWLDDAVLIGIALYAAIQLSKRFSARTVILVLLFIVLLAIAVVRSRDLGVGIYQFRQMAVPGVLLVFGMTIPRDKLVRAAPWVIGFITVGCLYGLLEVAGIRLIDPSATLGLNSFSSTNIRENGLPAAYRYFLQDGTWIPRVGGLILNPPSFGILAASGLVWLRFSDMRRSFLFILLALLFVGMTVASLGRGGFVVLALAILQPFITKYSGRLAFILIGAVLAYVAYSEVVQQGQSGRHAEGFFYGIGYALTNPLGGGFGLVGNSVNQLGLDGDSGAGESLAAIFLTATGWFAIVVLLWLLVKGIGAGRTMPGVALTAAVLVSLVSETAGGLDASGPLWILAGAALIGERSAKDVLVGVVSRNKNGPDPALAAATAPSGMSGS